MASVDEMTSAQFVQSLFATEDQRNQWNFAKNLFSLKDYKSLAAPFAQSCAGTDGRDLFSNTCSKLGLKEDVSQNLISVRDNIRDNNPFRGKPDETNLLVGQLGRELDVPGLVDLAITYDPGDPAARTQQSGVKPPEPSFVTKYLPETEMSRWTKTAKTLQKTYATLRKQKTADPKTGPKAALGALVDAWCEETLSLKPASFSSQVWEEKKELLTSADVPAQIYADLSAISSALQPTFSNQDWDTRDRKEYSNRLRKELINSMAVNVVERVLTESKPGPEGVAEFNTVESLVSKLIDLKKNQDDQTAAGRLDTIVTKFANAATGLTERNDPTEYWEKHQSFFTDKVGLSEDTFNKLSTMTDTLREVFKEGKHDYSKMAALWLTTQITDTRSRKIKATETKVTDARQTSGEETKRDMKEKAQPVQDAIKSLLTADEYISFKSVANTLSKARKSTQNDKTARIRFQHLNKAFMDQSFGQGPTAINQYLSTRKEHFESYGITQDTITETIKLADTLRQHFDGKDEETRTVASEWTKNALLRGFMREKSTAPKMTNGDTTKAKPTATDKDKIKNAETAVGGNTSATDAPAKAARRERRREPTKGVLPSTVTKASKLDTLANPTTRIVELTEEEASALETGTTEAPQTTVIDTHTERTRLPETIKRGAPEDTTVPPPAGKKARAPRRAPPPRTTSDETNTTQRHMTYVSTDGQTPYVPTAPQPEYQTTTTAAAAAAATETTEADGDTVMRDTTEGEPRGPFPKDVRTAASQFATKTRALFRTRMKVWGDEIVDDDGDQGALAWTGDKITFRARKADMTYVEEYEHDGEHFKMTCGTTRDDGEVVWQKAHDWDVKTGTLKCDQDWELDSRSPDAQAPAAKQYKDFERIVRKTGLSEAQFQPPFMMPGDRLFQDGKVNFAELPWKVIEALRDPAA